MIDRCFWCYQVWKSAFIRCFFGVNELETLGLLNAFGIIESGGQPLLDVFGVNELESRGLLDAFGVIGLGGQAFSGSPGC